MFKATQENEINHCENNTEGSLKEIHITVYNSLLSEPYLCSNLNSYFVYVEKCYGWVVKLL